MGCPFLRPSPAASLSLIWRHHENLEVFLSHLRNSRSLAIYCLSNSSHRRKSKFLEPPSPNLPLTPSAPTPWLSPQRSCCPMSHSHSHSPAWLFMSPILSPLYLYKPCQFFKPQVKSYFLIQGFHELSSLEIHLPSSDAITQLKFSIYFLSLWSCFISRTRRVVS